VRRKARGRRNGRGVALALVVAFGAPLFAVSSAGVPAAFAATGHKPPRANGYFKTLPPGAQLPSGKQCAARIHRSKWEPRPSNATPNARIVKQPVSLPANRAFNHAWQRQYKPRITGKFRGTTDEIIQWASCKWGISDELTRARAVQESDWHQKSYGDYESRSRGHCTSDWHGNPCPTSFGILQSKWYFRPGTYPRTLASTAFMIDSALAETRGCLDGMMWFGPQSRGKLWNCVGVWYSGQWGAGYSEYVNHVRQILRNKPWRHWPG
jgi:autotransporter family porin